MGVYCLTGGSFLFFALLCALAEMLRRRWPAGLVMAVFAGLLPRLSAQTLFLVSRKDVYFHLLPIFPSDPAFPVYPLLMIFFPLAMIGYRTGFLEKLQRPFNRFKPGARRIAGSAVVLILFSASAFFSVNPNTKLILAVRTYARLQRWDRVLKEVQGLSIYNAHLTCLTNRALFHSGLLLDELFAYPHYDGLYDLFIRQKAGFQDPIESSDFFLDLGFINEAEHWAYEALVIDGRTPWVLRRLAEVNLLRNERERATEFIHELGLTRYASWAKRFQPMLDDTAKIRLDLELQNIRDSIPDKDFLYLGDHKKSDLDHLLEKNPRNKMAFEYRIAASLINKQTGLVVNQIPKFAELGYPSLPRHVQEAVVLYASSTGKKDMDLSGYRINKSVIVRFNRLNQILGRYSGDKRAAASELSKSLGDTYWYYVIKADQAAQKP
jgi:hypothetical protein